MLLLSSVPTKTNFVGAMVNNFKVVNTALENLTNLWKCNVIDTRLIQNLEYINAFLELWFKENLNTRRLIMKLEGTQLLSRIS